MFRSLVSVVLTMSAGLALSADTLSIKGSDTIGGSLAPEWIEVFKSSHPRAAIELESLGSSTGFVGLFDGSADVAASSRPVKPKEVARAGELGIELREFVVGYDGIAVIVHPENPVAGLSVPEIAAIFRGEITSWSEVGGRAQSIRLLSRPSYSGTHGFFKDSVLRLGDRKRKDEFSSSIQWVEENDALVRSVAEDSAAIGYVGLGWVDESVKALRVARTKADPFVHPSVAAVRDGSYPVYRPLMLYTTGTVGGLTASFLRFVGSAQGQSIVARHGFVAAEVVGLDLGIESSQAGEGAKSREEIVRCYFALGGTRLTDDVDDQLREVARISTSEELKIIVSGHTDSTGSISTNQKVSLVRARVVARRLVQLGVPVDRISVSGEGPDRPISSNTSPEGRALNRRVDVQIVR